MTGPCWLLLGLFEALMWLTLWLVTFILPAARPNGKSTAPRPHITPPRVRYGEIACRMWFVTFRRVKKVAKVHYTRRRKIEYNSY